MSPSTCPTTCGLLSTAAIFISVGIVQLLAGIILIKSDYVYLLAGTDFIASSSNIIVGCLLGMSASSWESKLKRISVKNESRKNVLAGLYITVVAINATTAIIMILGDGNNLLTAMAEATNTSSKFVGEILTCAYVMSVCSPIVCIVVAIVCLSGNRLELIEDFTKIRKKKNKSISKSESYGWVFKDRPNLTSDSHVQSQSQSRTSSSGDCVFMENPVLNSSVKSTASSVTKDQKYLKIWAERRKKILQEITTPRCSVFSDNYLQFPEFDYSSYMETMLPRIKHTSLIRSKTASSSSVQSGTQSNPISNNSVILSGESIKKYLSPTKCRRATINRSNLTKNVNTEAFKQYLDSKRVSINNCREILNSEKHKVSYEIQDKIIQSCNQDKNVSKSPSKTFQQKLYRSPNAQNCCDHCNDTISNADTKNNLVNSSNKTANINDTLTKRDTHSISFDFAPETLKNQVELNLIENPLSQTSVNQLKCRLMKSFKHSDSEEHKLEYTNQNMRKFSSTEDIPLPRSSVILKTPMAGKMVPITIRNIPDGTNNIPVSDDKLSTSINKSLTCELKNDGKTLYSSINLNDIQISTKEKHGTLKRKSDINHELNNQELGSMDQTEERKKKLQNVFAAAESSENICNQSESCSNRKINALKFVNVESSNETAKESVNTETSDAAHGNQKRIKSRSKKQPAIRFPSIFTGCPTGPDGQTDISNFIMDGDSLLGLSDEELLDRTKRIRVLRKSVEIRSKEKKKNDQS